MRVFLGGTCAGWQWRDELQPPGGGSLTDRRTWFQKLFGFCPYCGRWFRRKIRPRRQNTAYCDEASNWVAACPECFEEIQLYWAERWEEYYASCY